MNSLGLCEKILMNWQAVSPNVGKDELNVFINILKTYRGLEQQYRIMLEAVKLLPMYEYKRDPTMPTFVFEKYDSVKDEVASLPTEKRNEFYKRLYQNKDASTYFKKCEENLSQNLSNALWLEDMIRVMKEANDEVELPKVIAVYNRYPQTLGKMWKRKVFVEDTNK